MQPQSPSPQYDFIMDSAQKPAKKLSLPNLPKPVKTVLFAAVGLIFLILVWALLFGHKSSGTQATINVIARAQEISRVSALAQNESKDTNTQALAATVQASMVGESSQLTGYLKAKGTKVDAKKLTVYLDRTVDSQFLAASQNNNLETTYAAYLKTNLAAYQDDLRTAYSSASKPLQDILSSAFESVKVILSAPGLKS